MPIKSVRVLLPVVPPGGGVDPAPSIAFNFARVSGPAIPTGGKPFAVWKSCTALSVKLLNAAATGFFGNLTLKAVQDFQTANGLPPVGIAGPLTRAKLNAILGAGSTPPPGGTTEDRK